MTPKERTLARLQGKPVDRIPNFSILMSFAAGYIGRPMSEFCTDYRVMTEANIKCCEDFGIDLLNTMSDPYRETADYGAKMSYPLENIPIAERLIKNSDDVKNLKPFRIEDSVRMLDRLNAVEYYKKNFGNTYPIMGWIEGMAAESADLMGLSELCIALYDEPGMVSDIMDVCYETAVNCIAAQIDAGADIIGIGDAAASVLGPEFYRNLILPYEQKLFAEIKSRGAYGRLHICGDISVLLEDIKTCGADIVDIDWMVDFKEANEILSGHALVCGNFDPVSVVMSGTAETVFEAVNKCIDDAGSNCIIMPGCEVPKITPAENLLAIHEALVRHTG